MKYLTYSSITIIVLLVLVMGIFVVKPAITGYSVYKKMQQSELSFEDLESNVDDLKTSLTTTGVNLSSCNAQNEKLYSTLSINTERLESCNSELGKVKAERDHEIVAANIQTSEYKVEINRLNRFLSETERAYDTLAQNLADNLCCKAKVDNPHISGYEIRNNMIICLEDGELFISC